VALTSVDRDLLRRLLQKDPGSWNDFVDRFLSLIYHVVHSTAHLRSVKLTPEDVEDISGEVQLQLIANDYKVLKAFRGNASLATYLTVIARRTCVHELTRRQSVKEAIRKGDVRNTNDDPSEGESLAAIKGMDRLEEVETLIRQLKSRREREIVRLYYFEGRTYEEISTETGVPVNTIGSVLSRARERLRQFRKSVEMPALTPSMMRNAAKKGG
jgi:RNA polymerase sigma-70 factor, ECF subfamily